MPLPQPPDTTPLAQVFAALRALATETDNLRRVGRYQQATSTSGTSKRVEFDRPFPPGVVPVVLTILDANAPINFGFNIFPGSVDEYGFTSHIWRSTGSSSATNFMYTATAPG